MAEKRIVDQLRKTYQGDSFTKPKERHVPPENPGPLQRLCFKLSSPRGDRPARRTKRGNGHRVFLLLSRGGAGTSSLASAPVFCSTFAAKAAHFGRGLRLYGMATITPPIVCVKRKSLYIVYPSK